jgi:hypothetical protein
MHALHKAAEKRKNFLLADMIKTKCFVCDAERYSSTSIQKIRIYQCLSRRILNSLSEEKEKGFKPLEIVSENEHPSNKRFIFDS